MAVNVSGIGTASQDTVASPGRASVNSGAVVSIRVISCSTVLLLPHSSSAVQVRMTSAVPAQSLSRTRLSEYPISTSESQLSMASAAPRLPTPKSSSQDSVVSCGTKVKTGASVSVRSMDWMSVSALPQASMAT